MFQINIDFARALYTCLSEEMFQLGNQKYRAEDFLFHSIKTHPDALPVLNLSNLLKTSIHETGIIFRWEKMGYNICSFRK